MGDLIKDYNKNAPANGYDNRGNAHSTVVYPFIVIYNDRQWHFYARSDRQFSVLQTDSFDGVPACTIKRIEKDRKFPIFSKSAEEQKKILGSVNLEHVLKAICMIVWSVAKNDQANFQDHAKEIWSAYLSVRPSSNVDGLLNYLGQLVQLSKQDKDRLSFLKELESQKQAALKDVMRIRENDYVKDGKVSEKPQELQDWEKNLNSIKDGYYKDGQFKDIDESQTKRELNQLLHNFIECARDYYQGNFQKCYTDLDLSIQSFIAITPTDKPHSAEEFKKTYLYSNLGRSICKILEPIEKDLDSKAGLGEIDNLQSGIRKLVKSLSSKISKQTSIFSSGKDPHLDERIKFWRNISLGSALMSVSMGFLRHYLQQAYPPTNHQCNIMDNASSNPFGNIELVAVP